MCKLNLSNIFRSGKSRGNEPSLLAQAIDLECQAESLLTEHRDILDLHDEHAPFDGSAIGFGRAVMSARLASAEGRAVQRMLDSGAKERDVRFHLNRGKKALEFALSIVE